MSSAGMRVACIQMNSVAEREANLEQASLLLQQAASAGAELAVLPENFSLMGASPSDKQMLAEPQEQSTVLAFLSAQAITHRMAIVGGSTLLQGGQGKLRNACPVFTADGRMCAIYDKIHLFDVDLDGGESYCESATVVAGEYPCAVELGAFHVGLSICYDIRFPELYRHYADVGCDILCVVAAFTEQTGRAHWQTLLCARAIENQCYVLASAQWGGHADGRRTWGHSMIIDPWGEVIALQEEGTGVIMADLTSARITHIRNILPSLKHRKM
ncbi:MAG: hydrolase [Zetaproteobacteria bacterium CG12_big_fil_rev_8_21_14_0_65_54_13]|nr:MAG: hydrolase [Zetaproteobacteria bacterium CG12_big_fil_rev_8_21_14_0_65_54_13]PIX54795.1 MAG: hydrolase [Zetaproteobacteria bacterium CG_4_10_14_3_um_filter_54_28]PJA29649.1 MAG: hydrolase [Zetaproteobacteria bacterium CG_4_9_14_3_um_filter_54_145]